MMSEGDDGHEDDEAALWRRMTRDVKKMPGKDYGAAKRAESPGRKSKVATPRPVRRKPDAPAEAVGPPAGSGLDRRTEMRLTRGQMRIEARIDLHGMTQVQARTALAAFIAESHARGRRCVLVITGKGSLNKPSVIKQNVPAWLAEAPVAAMVLKSVQAQPKDGGAGAVYVLLRRRR